MIDPADIATAAAWIAEADALVVGAGAGMGVDSGLPDFRGTEGFWRAYPAFCRRGLRFEELANPRWFTRDPATAWGFYGHRLNLYRATSPHEGFAILLSWARAKRHGAFAYTSNVDGHFQRSGFTPDRVVECHGSIHHLQCVAECGQSPWSGHDVQVTVDEAEFLAVAPLPACPSCGGVARPQILMFGDWQWDGQRTAAQEANLHHWLKTVGPGRIVAVELGAGTAIPTVRLFCERLVERRGARLVRINPRECEAPAGQIGMASGALAALRAIDAALEGRAARA
ncbi:MAG: NAD-dependent deacetylase [Deltaproteobacteria bacterium]|nr:NAD-dependent deacetylase [Deltaproteobacteria bacterium]